MFLLADWMSNPFDRVVCGDFAGKKRQQHTLKYKYLFDH